MKNHIISKSLIVLLKNFSVLAIVLLLTITCGDDEPLVIQLPSVTTSAMSDITKTTAISGGVISDDGNGNIEARGVCWNTTGNPQTTDDKTNEGTGTGNFSSTLTGLEVNTTYFVRAYATNSAGTAYGQEVSFTTNDIGLIDGLISYWKLDETTGSVATDETGNASLNLINNPTWFSPGKIGNGIDFGTSSTKHLEKTGVNSSNKNTHSLSAWIYLENDEADIKYIMGMNSGAFAINAGAAEVKIFLDNTNKLVAMYHVKNGGTHNTPDVMQRTSGASISLNTWVHVAGVINNGDIQLYINGVNDTVNPVQNGGLTATIQIAGGRITVGNARLYNGSYITTRWFRGKMDGAGLWDRALRQKDITSLYNSGSGNQYPFVK